MSDWWNQPMRTAGEPEAVGVESPSRCPWCDQPAIPGAGSCPNCGAIMTQREDLGGLLIPGVTTVDPAMQAHSYSSSLIGSQSRMSTLSTIGAVGGTAAQVVSAAAILARDGIRGMGGGVAPEDLGKPSQAALEMSRRLRQTAGEASANSARAPIARAGAGESEAEQDVPDGAGPEPWG
jgi:hypothetical protein